MESIGANFSKTPRIILTMPYKISMRPNNLTALFARFLSKNSANVIVVTKTTPKTKGANEPIKIY